MTNTGATHAWVEPRGPRPGNPPEAMMAMPRQELMALVHDERLVRLVVDYTKPHPLLLLGPTGIGKTATLAAIAQGVRPRLCWTDGHSLAEAERRHPLGDGEAPLVESAKSSAWLIVDDPDWARTDHVFREVLEHRYRLRKLTLVASGQTFDGFKQRFGDAIVRRILEGHAHDGESIDLWQQPKAQT